jgi:cytochrome c biogenesis factor
MNLTGYTLARAQIIFIGKALTPILLLLTFLLLLVVFISRFKKYQRQAQVIFTLFLTTGFVSLIWFHYQIYQLLPLRDPLSQELLGRFQLPLWIEGEKLYFWALCLAFFLLARVPETVKKLSLLSLSLIVWINLIFQNPFTQPLPLFHQEVTRAAQAFQTGQLAIQFEAVGQLYGRLHYFYNSSYMWTHPPLLFLSYAAFTIAFISALLMLCKGEGDAEKSCYFWTKLGYLPLTLGILIGYPWAILAWQNQPWWWAPKINISLMMWVFYTAYLHSHLQLKRRGFWGLSASLNLLSFLALLFTYLTTYLIPGVHSYG